MINKITIALKIVFSGELLELREGYAVNYLVQSIRIIRVIRRLFFM